VGGCKGQWGWCWYVLVAKREIWLVGVSGMGKTEQSRNLLVMERRGKKRMNEIVM